MIRKFLQNYILGDLILPVVGPKGDTGLMGPPGVQGAKGDTGSCDTVLIETLQSQINDLKSKVDSLLEKCPNTRFADVLFANGIVDADGLKLNGKTEDASFDYTLEFFTDGTLKIINDVQTLDSVPAYINLEVRGEGNLAIMIIQTLVYNGSTHVFKKPLCSTAIHSEQRDYHFFNVEPYSRDYMIRYADTMSGNKMDLGS